MNTIDIIDTNPHYYNLGKIEGTMWKHKIAITTNLRRSHANAFGNHRLCGCFTKSIMRHQAKYDNEPLGFVAFEYTNSGNLQFVSIWSQLSAVDELDDIFEGDNVQHSLYSDGNIVDGLGYSVINKQISNYDSAHNDDWIGYITNKSHNEFVYYTPFLVKTIKGVNKGINKINKQSGLIDERSIYLFKYLSKQRITSHNDSL